MPGINEMLQALFGRVPQNATQGGVPAGQGQFRPQNAPLGPLNSSAVPGRSYASPGGSGRAESAGYTTSSPGWRQDQVPTVPPPPATTGAIGPGASATPFPRPDPVVTGGIGGAGPARAATPEMIANATTTPSALFEPLSNAGVNTPSALFQPLPTQSPTSVPGLPGFGAQSPSSLGTFLPTSGPTTQPSDLPGANAQSPSSLGSFATVPGPSRAPQLEIPGGPSSARPPKVIHPDNPTTGKLAKGKDRAQTPKRPKRGGQYDLRQQGSRRAKN